MWLKYNNDSLKFILSAIYLHFSIFSVIKIPVNHDRQSGHSSWKNSRIPLNFLRRYFTKYTWGGGDGNFYPHSSRRIGLRLIPTQRAAIYVKSVQIRSYYWSVSSRIQTEYGEIRRISSYSVRIRENTDQK